MTFLLIYFIMYGGSAATSQSVTFTVETQCVSAGQKLDKQIAERNQGFHPGIYSIWTCQASGQQ